MSFKSLGLVLGLSVAMIHPIFSVSDGRINTIRVEGVTVTGSAVPEIEKLASKIGQKLQESAILNDVQTLYASGYFKHVEARPVYTDDRGVQLVYLCEEYPTINAIQCVGVSAVSTNELMRPEILKPGDVLNTNRLSDYVASIESVYRAKGFDLAQVVQAVMGPGNVVVIEVGEGTISEVEINGVSGNLTPVILRELKSKADGYFNSGQLRDDREKMLKMGYFSDVESPRLEESIDHKRVKVIFDTKARKTNTLDAGLEYFEQKGQQPLTGFIRTDIRHVVIPSDVVSLKLQGAWKESSAYIQGYSGRYSQPWILNRWPLSISVGAWSETLNEFLTKDRNNSARTAFTNQRVGVDMSLGFPFSDELTVGTTAKSENVFPGDSSGLSEYKIRSLSFNFDYRTIKNATNPHNGIVANGSLEIGGKIAGITVGGLRFTRWIWTGSMYHEVASSDVIATRFTAGEFSPDNGATSTFENEGFDLGGSNTIRGYKETFPVFIGNRELLVNLEWRHDFSPDVQGILFWDTGRAFSGDWPSDVSGFQSGIGIGVRIFTPVGAVRLDLAQGESTIVHFGLGQVF